MQQVFDSAFAAHRDGRLDDAERGYRATLAGNPAQAVHTHFASPCGQLAAGVWEGACGQWTVNFTESEYCEILEGVSVIRDADGTAKTVRAGDRFLIPAGFKGTWEVVEPCKKIFVSVEFKR